MEILSTIKSKSKSLNEIMVVLGGVILLFAASQVEIPLQPVPITLQTVAVMLIGLTYSPRRAVESHLRQREWGVVQQEPHHADPVSCGGGGELYNP